VIWICPVAQQHRMPGRAGREPAEPFRACRFTRWATAPRRIWGGS